jgi:TrpR-related protein YerC/YecD
MNTDISIWREDMPQRLAAVFTSIDDMAVMQNFLRDVLTEKEIIEICARLEAAKMLCDGEKYTDIVSKTKLSSRTVARISGWLKNGCGGYRAALEIIGGHHRHIPPARAE